MVRGQQCVRKPAKLTSAPFQHLPALAVSASSFFYPACGHEGVDCGKVEWGLPVPPSFALCIFPQVWVLFVYLGCYSILIGDVSISVWRNMLPSDTLLFLLILYSSFHPYLPPSPLPTFSLTFREAMPPSCPLWGSCCGTWSCTHPPCRSPPDHASPTARQWRPQPSRLCLLSPVQAWRVTGSEAALALAEWIVFTSGASPHQVHSKEGLLSIRALSAPHCFISNAHLVLVRSHLGPPQPRRFTQHNCVSVSHLLDLNVGALCTHTTTTHSAEFLTVQFGLRGSCQCTSLTSTVSPSP